MSPARKKIDEAFKKPKRARPTVPPELLQAIQTHWPKIARAIDTRLPFPKFAAYLEPFKWDDTTDGVKEVLRPGAVCDSDDPKAPDGCIGFMLSSWYEEGFDLDCGAYQAKTPAGVLKVFWT
jgi:hypothetical protein